MLNDLHEPAVAGSITNTFHRLIHPRWTRVAFLTLFLLYLLSVASAGAAGPRHVGDLRCDDLLDPLGVDDPAPTFSWKIEDNLSGARQTAYRIGVYKTRPKPGAAPDVWDSGRIGSPASTGVAYAGPLLEASHRYFWTVEIWGKDSTPYPVSAASWWETGLMAQSAWQAKWIGFEAKELHSLRTSGAQWITSPGANHPDGPDDHYDFRFHFPVTKPIARAVLYTTGEDTAAAWLNGIQLMSAKARVPWNDMPWMTYEHKEITAQLSVGENLLAIQITKYQAARATGQRSPMSACIYLTYTDGTTQVLISDTEHWKTTREAEGSWWTATYDDAKWDRPILAYDPAAPAQFGPGRPWPTGPVATLRHAFEVSKKLVSARLYATALGAYSFQINGAQVGDQILAPGYMDFREHVPYQAYDVTAMLKSGPNAIGAYIAVGWYATPLTWFHETNSYGASQPALRAQLRLEFADGSVSWVLTDGSWKAELSEITQAEIYDGETLDARKRTAGWDGPGFDDAAWMPAQIVAPNEPQIVWQYFQPIRQERVVKAQAVASPAPGVYIFDFGQNMSAVPILHVTGQRGDVVRLRFGELLHSDGTLYTENLRSAKATDTYILAGGSSEDFQPRFTFHGFRYVEVTGLRQPPAPDTLQAAVIHTDAPFTMRLSSGSPMVNKLWSNVMWGQRSNFVGLPTDCPQRDERLGWTADAQVFWRTAAFNMDLDAFTRKFGADLRGTQVGTSIYGVIAPGIDKPNFGYGAGWSDAGVIIPWTGWIQSGDRRIIDENWDGMDAYLNRIEQENPNHLWRNDFGGAFGDWLTPTITTPEDLIATAYWAYDAGLMEQMAVATGRPAEADRYAKLHESIRTAFQQAYVKSDGIVGSVDRYPSIPPPTIHPSASTQDKDKFVETQTGYVLALHMNLVPDALRRAAAKHLVKLIQENHWLLGTGFLGTPYLLEVLSDAGYSDLAYKLLLNSEYPSWGYQVEHGATTTWERWNGDQMMGDPSMNSYNHYAYGAVAEWLYRYAAGIDTKSSGAGFREIVLHPNFDSRLGSLDVTYDSPYGAIHSAWTVKAASVNWEVTIPPNTTAVLHAEDTNAESYRVNGTLASKRDIELGPGLYKLTAHLKEASAR